MSRFAVAATSSSHQFLRSAMARLSLAIGSQASTIVGDRSPKKRSRNGPNAFTLFQKDFFAKHKNDDEPPFATLIKGSHIWRTLPTDEKMFWHKKREEVLSQTKTQAKLQAPQKPKSPSAYLLFRMDYYAKHKKENKAPFETLVKGAQVWSNMSEGEKAPWYKKLDESFPGKTPATKKPWKISGYSLFMKENLSGRPEARTMKEHFKMTTDKWRSLSDDKKQYYTKLAEQRWTSMNTAKA